MARQSIVPTITEKLEPYLDKKDKEWWDQTGERTPTLPTTTDGKVNVRQLVDELKLNPNYVQHFFNKKELADMVNAMASVQGVAPIGSRAICKSDDEIIRNEIQATKKASKQEHEAYLEAIATISQLRKENEQLRATVNFIQETGCVLRQTEIEFE